MKSATMFKAVCLGIVMVCPFSTNLFCSSQKTESSPQPVASKNAQTASLASSSFKTIFGDIAATVTPSIVSVILTKIDTVTYTQNPFFNFFGNDDTLEDNPFDFFFQFPFSDRGHGKSKRPKTEKREYREQGLGSGVIVSQDGFILTNFHVVAGASEIEVKLSDERSYEAKVVGVDSLSDVAVIKIKEKVQNLPVAKLGDDLKIRPGDWSLAIGNPFSLTSTVTLGIISALHREVGNPNLYQNFIQTDAAINPGNSGGALVNIEGEVIGINTMIYTQTGGFMGIGFAIPISMAKSVMKDIITKGKVVRGWIGVGIQNVNKAMRPTLNLGSRKGVLVSDVFKGQPADKAGIKRGDVITSIAGKNVENANQLRNTVAELKPGSKAPVVLVRNGKEMTVELAIEERSEKMLSRLEKGGQEKPGPHEGRNKSEQRFGLTLSDPTPELRSKYDIPDNARGVVITEVSQSLTDARASLQEGDVIEQVKVKDKDYQAVESMKQFDEITKNIKKEESMLLVVVRKSASLFIGFTVH